MKKRTVSEILWIISKSNRVQTIFTLYPMANGHEIKIFHFAWIFFLIESNGEHDFAQKLITFIMKYD